MFHPRFLGAGMRRLVFFNVFHFQLFHVTKCPIMSRTLFKKASFKRLILCPLRDQECKIVRTIRINLLFYSYSHNIYIYICSLIHHSTSTPPGQHSGQLPARETTKLGAALPRKPFVALKKSHLSPANFITSSQEKASPKNHSEASRLGGFRTYCARIQCFHRGKLR